MGTKMGGEINRVGSGDYCQENATSLAPKPVVSRVK